MGDTSAKYLQPVIFQTLNPYRAMLIPHHLPLPLELLPHLCNTFRLTRVMICHSRVDKGEVLSLPLRNALRP